MSYEIAPQAHPPSRVAVVINPSKKNWSAARDQLAADVARAGLPPLTVYETTVQDPGAAQAAQAAAAGHDLVIAAGGDGTVREVALGLLGTEASLGIVPVGTANLFARNLGLGPRRRQRSIDIALGRHAARLDAGLARLRMADGWSADRLFLVMTGIGNDAATVLGTRDHLKNRVGWLAYAESATRHVLRQPIPMTIRLDEDTTGPGVVTQVRAWSVLAGNCGRVPGGIVLFPDAQLDDGWLDTMTVSVTHVGQWAAIGAKGLLGLRRDVPAMSVGRAREMRVIPQRPAPVQLDGDVFADVHELHVRLAQQALTIKVPPPRSQQAGSRKEAT